MNKKHISKVGKCIGMACLLFVCAMAQSCRDEYFFDDTAPDFVGPSIYDYLNEQGEFKYFLRVVDDLNYKEVLQRTGSKTLFVANDQAFVDGIWREWGFSDYEQLTPAHKRMILYGAMLDNAYLLEMLSKMQSMGVNAEPVPGQCLRRVASLSETDTVGLFAPVDLPENNPYWDSFKGGTIRLALDASSTMLTHFTEEQLYMKGITEKDLDRLVAGGRGTARMSDYYIYDKKVIKEKSDVTCKNGYVHQLDGLLILPSNMAEELRQNGSHEDLAKLKGLQDGALVEAYMDSTTLLFSRMLDRFAVPKPIDEGTEFAQNFNRIYGVNEKLYEKKYFTEGRFTSYSDGTKVHNALGTLLFDPGWNAYSAGSTAKEFDMAAILAPSDKAVISYFTDKAGRSLWNRYAPEAKNVVEAIDSIPIDVIQPLVRNHMQMSFNSTVPSKFEYIVDDARDPMNVVVEDVMKVILANNGVVYVMDTLYSPARYNSVIAPVMLDEALSVFNKGIKEAGVNDGKSGLYDKYLLSMGNKFGLIVTANENMVFYDPYTEARYWADGTLKDVEEDRLAYKMLANVQADGSLLVKAQKFKYVTSNYNPETNTYVELEEVKNETGNFKDILEEILEYNIVIGDMNSVEDCQSRRKYYMSKGYGTVKVERGTDGKVSRILGGREIQYGSQGVPVAKTHTMTNGQTFELEGAMIQPPTQTVSNVLYRDSFAEFRKLCEPSTKVLEFLFGPKDDKGNNPPEWNNYLVFYDQVERHSLVRMFNTYHYTVYVPTNAAMADAHRRGLLTWEDLEAEIDAFSSDDPEELEAFKLSLQAGADQIAKFVRYHFQDNSVYVDNVEHSLAVDKGDIDGDGVRDYEYQNEVSYETSAFNDEKKTFCSVLVKTENNTISVRGDFGDNKDARVCYVIKDVEHETYNVMTRENQYSRSTISTSSYAVVHQIDNFLAFGGEGGIYDLEKVNEETGEKGMFVR